MKAEFSPLVLNGFNLFELSIKTVFPEKEIDVQAVFEEYEIDIDFEHQSFEDGTLAVFCKIMINQEPSPHPGYQILVHGAGYFSIQNPDTLSKEDISSLFHHSGTSITIQALRSIVSRATSDSPFGKYMIPTFDLQKLLIQKYQPKA